MRTVQNRLIKTGKRLVSFVKFRPQELVSFGPDLEVFNKFFLGPQKFAILSCFRSVKIYVLCNKKGYFLITKENDTTHDI